MFDVAAESYDRFMGRYSRPLAERFADFATVAPGHRVLDVGCGPGALVGELVARLGPTRVAAVDPSKSFAGAARTRHPDVDVRIASAEELPFGDGEFDAALAQLVVHFMADPLRGLGEMRRVTRPGGTVAACVWDHGGGGGPLSGFWRAARELDPDAVDESRLPGAREGELVALLEQVGLREAEGALLSVTVDHESFEDWWEPFGHGVGPAGSYVSRLGPERRGALRGRLREELGEAGVSLTVSAWAARGRV